MPWFAGILFLVALVALLAVARRRTHDRGINPRRFAVLALLALLTVVPFTPAFFQPATFGRDAVVRVEEGPGTGEVRYVEVTGSGVDLAVALLAYWMVFVYGLAFVRLPRRYRHLERLPEVADPGMAARFAQWVTELGLPPVPLREERSEAGMLVNARAVVGISPFVVASDGALHRLDPAERDALLGHELGHVARRHLVKLIAMLALLGAVAVEVSLAVPTMVALLWLFAAQVFLRMVVSYREELAADRIGARLAGAPAMVRALDKTHAANSQLEAHPWLYSLLSHPHLAVRTGAIRRHATVAEAAQIETDEVVVRRCVLAHRCGIATGTIVLAAVLVLGAMGWQLLAGLLAVALAAAPLVLLIALQPWQDLRDARRLGLFSRWATSWQRLGLLLGCIAALVGGGGIAGQIGAALALTALALFLAAILWGRRERRVRRRLTALLQYRDLRGWLEVYEKLPGRLRRKPDLWATCSDLCYALGDTARAEAELDRLLARWPRFLLARIVRLMRLRARDPLAAVPMARELVRLLPRHPAAIASLAGVLRSAGQLEEAWEHAQRTIRLRPRTGVYHAITARIATARGDLVLARTALETAQRLDPGEPRVLLAQAELEVAERSPTAAQAVARVRDVVDRTLFSYLESDVAALQQRLAAVTA